jgi:hypothetical protein
MITNRKRIITIERRQRTVIRSRPRRTFWCEFCGHEVETLSPEKIAETFGIASREIYRRIETGAIHFAENTNGSIFVCVNSLKADGEK